MGKILILTSFVSGMGVEKVIERTNTILSKNKNTQHVLFLSVAVRVI